MGSAPFGSGPAPPEPGLWTPAPSGPGWLGPCLSLAVSHSHVLALCLVLAAAEESPGSRTRADPPTDTYERLHHRKVAEYTTWPEVCGHLNITAICD